MDDLALAKVAASSLTGDNFELLVEAHLIQIWLKIQKWFPHSKIHKNLIWSNSNIGYYKE